MELIEKLKIPGKQGPFYLRKLGLDDLFAFFRSGGNSEQERLRRLVQVCLVNKAGKPVFTDKQLDKLDRDLGGVRVLMLANRAKDLNEFELLQGLEGAVEAAEKN